MSTVAFLENTAFDCSLTKSFKCEVEQYCDDNVCSAYSSISLVERYTLMLRSDSYAKVN